MTSTSPNTAYTLRAYALSLRDIAHFGRNVIYAGNVMCNLKNRLTGAPFQDLRNFFLVVAFVKQ